ncbi:MAG TPA: glycosyltransferase family 39 protein, partial [Thermomicrobiales bacterium]|nr:glycosyltransferase family 39 protein [Thermomicrobiales bacterium]
MSEIAQENGSRFEGTATRSLGASGPLISDPISWVRSGLGATTTLVASAVVFGFLVRVIAAVTLTPHVDEPSSVLAAHMVAERGIPILPSGAPYLQGATLSYLLQPFVWLGFGEIHHLPLIRMVLVLAGTITIWLSYRLGRAVTGSASVGAVTAMLVAIDPVSVQWSAHVRMYGLLQALTFALVWAYIRLLQGNTGWRQIGLVVGLFWVAVFTHVGASLLGAAMALAAVLVYRRDVVRQWRLLVTLVASASASILLLTLNKVLGTANEPVGDASSSSSLSFVGDSLLAPLASIKAIPTEGVLQRLTAGITLYWLVPGLIVAVSTIIGARHLLRGHAGDSEMRVSVLTLLSFYWLPLILVVGATISPEVRYLLHMHLLGYVFVAVLAVGLLDRAARQRSRDGVVIGSLSRYGAVGAVVIAIGASLLWRLDNPVHQPDYNAAMAYVAKHHEPGEPV